MRADADKTKTKANDLHAEADRLANDVEDAERALRDYENQATEDEQLAREVKLHSYFLTNKLISLILLNIPTVNPVIEI